MPLRHQVIKLAATMPKGSPEKQALLAILKEARAPKEYMDAKILGLRLEKLAAQLGGYDYDKKAVEAVLDGAFMNLLRLAETYEGSPGFGGDAEEAEDERNILIDDLESAFSNFGQKAARVESLWKSLEAIERITKEARKLVRAMR